MSVFRSAILALCAIAIAPSIAFADGNTGMLFVRVMDAKTGKPASGWTVQVTARDGDSQALTGTSGEATFLSVTPGLTRVDVLQHGALGACPAVIMVSANEETVVNVHVKKTNAHEIGCSPRHAQTMVKPGVMSDVYDIY
ncbi:MAG TPA: hypothetical protein VJP85_15040 [Candidatus Baltobacteraceae bacterium]|nr:hypothetical protein [Candidatus Baltobacteraceae bacterium]